MIQYLKNICQLIKNAKKKTKIFLGILFAIYLGIILICTIGFQYNYTSPGTLNRINEVITIEDREVTNKFYTVSVFTETKYCTILEILLRKLDPKQDIITKEEYGSSYTTNEETKAGEAQKAQSIQDSIICAYDLAKEDGYDVNLIKTFEGICICYMPANKFGTGPESLQPKDIITKIGDTTIDSIQTLCDIVSYYYEDERYKDSSITCPVIEILRSGEKITLDNCNVYCLAQLGGFYQYSVKYAEENNLKSYYDFLVNYMYESYQLDTENSTPKFSINKASSIGPSGGLCQMLYVYNALTNNSLVSENGLITATGTILSDGTVGEIGGVDKKVYTIDIYMSKCFFVPEANYEEAMEAYNTIKSPNFEIVSIKNARDAINYLKNAGETNE